jgi:thiopeptide-type bacteriocin biosynthesis protein
VYVPLSRFLLRAPLLPVAALGRGSAALLKHPLGAQAIAHASPSLAEAANRSGRKPVRKTGQADRALDRYARRAAFRATPHGLLAGVAVGRLGRTTTIATGSPRAHRASSWEAVEAATRTLLDEPEVREQIRLRAAPSAIASGRTVRWLGPGDPFVEEREAELDERVAAILEAAHGWAPWPAVRELAGGDGDADEFLLLLLDDGLLQSDLAPPLVGPPPADHLHARMAALGREAPPLPEDQATLLFDGDARFTLARAAVTRAARLVPLLVRLQEALAPPASERLAQPALADALDAITDGFGAGAFPAAALASESFGVSPAGDDEGTAPAPLSPRLLALFVDAFAGAAREGRVAAALDSAAVTEALVDEATSLPPRTAELFLVPAPTGRRDAAGTGWLLGLHAPAGASFGRFGHALGAPLREALTELDTAERRAFPDDERVDVAFTPSAPLSALAAHPPIRSRALALTHWTTGDTDLTLRDLALVADPASPTGLWLRAQRPSAPGDGRSITPSPLARVRSATAPAGLARLMVGWSLQRQHAPWALPLGPFAELAFVPRLSIDGFVVLPASWRLPASVRAGGPRARVALGRFRRTARLPRFVQVGEGDELLPVDLSAPDAAGDLAGHERLFEIWPPLDAVVDRDGRRLEAVVMVVADRADVSAPPELMDVAPPAQAAPLAGWRTFKLFGGAAHQRPLLAAAAEVVRAGRAASELDRWFFLPYVDGPGRRPHLRLRVHASGDPATFERRLRRALERQRADGTLTTLEVTDYTPERGRFRDDELGPLHALWESDSDLVSQLPARDAAADRVVDLVRTLDALAAGLGLDPAARQALALERRRAAARETHDEEDAAAEADALFRACGRTLRAALRGPVAGDPDSAAFKEYRARLAAAPPLAAPALPRLIPTLLHHAAVRVAGPDRDVERLAYVCWQRTLEGLAREGRAR